MQYQPLPPSPVITVDSVLTYLDYMSALYTPYPVLRIVGDTAQKQLEIQITEKEQNPHA